MCCGSSCPVPCAPPRQPPESLVAEALTGLLAMMVLAFLRIPIAISMGIVGIVGYAYMRDWNWAVAFATAETKIYETGRNYTLSVIPLFILMGNLVTRARMSQELFRTAYAFIGHLRGGLAMATILGCAGFGAICGSSIATAATFAKVAYPSMKKFGYADYLATVAIGVAKLGWLDADDAAVIGAFIVFGLALAYKGVTSVIALFTLVMGGIYGGVFTAIEGAAIGAFGAMIFAIARRTLNWKTLYASLVESARTTSMLFLILIGALMFAEFVNITTMPGELRDLVKRFELHPILVVAAIMTIYVILGTAMEELSMILLTVPVFFPLVVHLGLDPVWFGILIVVVVEIGLISPPVGMNLFVLNTLLPQVPTRTIFRGVLPFMAADCVRLAILVAFPIISTYLPGMMK